MASTLKANRTASGTTHSVNMNNSHDTRGLRWSTILLMTGVMVNTIAAAAAGEFYLGVFGAVCLGGGAWAAAQASALRGGSCA